MMSSMWSLGCVISVLLLLSTLSVSQQLNGCPQTCIDVIQGHRLWHVEPIHSNGNVQSFYNYNEDGNLSFNGDDIVPLIPNQSIFMIHQGAPTCSLDFVIVHDSRESPSGGQVWMRLNHFDVERAAVKDGDKSSNRYRYDSSTGTSETFWEWGGAGDELPAVQTNGMAAKWGENLSAGDCLELEAKFIKGIDFWRYVPGPVASTGELNPDEYMYLDQDTKLKVCMGTCVVAPKNKEILPLVPNFGNRKKLVVYAGPHETGGDIVTNFFIQGARPGGAMESWVWPVVEFKGKILQHPFAWYVRNQENENIKNAVVDAVVSAWDKSEHGIIIGAAEFDKIGPDPDTGEDALAALEVLVQSLGIANEDVDVVLAYRSPRVDQWNSVQTHFDTSSYSNFVCSTEVAEERWEWLDTALNPFKIAITYVDMGYNVNVIDYEGTITQGLDLAHQVACSVMAGVICEGGYVKGLKHERMSGFSKAKIQALNATELQDLEELFNTRDCYYKYLLENRPGFQIVNRQSAWSSCAFQHNPFYQRVSDTDFLMNVIQSQMSCTDAPVDVNELVQSKILQKGNNLVLLAGPRETHDIQIAQFLTKFASSTEGNERSPSFGGWKWPTSSSILLHDKPAHHLYDLLVTSTDDRGAQSLLLDTIRDSWNEMWHGVVIGSNEFERVDNPSSGYDPIAALKMITDELRISPHDVTIVVNYRTPRLDQWSALFHSHFNASNYQDFLCSDKESNKRLQFLETSANPLKVATEYHKAGYRVVVVDQAGLTEDGKDLAHALTCNVLDGVDCEAEWIRGLEKNTIATTPVKFIDELSLDKRIALEEYFISRDCHYMFFAHLNDTRSAFDTNSSGVNTFQVLHHHSLWKHCLLTDEAKETYASLADADFFLDLLRAQVGCADSSASDLSDELLSTNKETSGNDVMRDGIKIAIASLFGVIVVALISLYCVKKKKRTKRIQKWQGKNSAGLFVSDPRMRSLHPAASSGSSEIVFERPKTRVIAEDEDNMPMPLSFPPLSAFMNIKKYSSVPPEEPKKTKLSELI